MAALVSDEILSAPISKTEAETVASRFLGSVASRTVITVGSLADDLGMKPLLIARAVSELRGDGDRELIAAIKRNDYLISKVGTARLSPEAMAGDRRLKETFWRHTDPLGVYRPGDMWYVDENHKWLPYCPILILAPTAFADAGSSDWLGDVSGRDDQPTLNANSRLDQSELLNEKVSCGRPVRCIDSGWE